MDRRTTEPTYASTTPPPQAAPISERGSNEAVGGNSNNDSGGSGVRQMDTSSLARALSDPVAGNEPIPPQRVATREPTLTREWPQPKSTDAATKNSSSRTAPVAAATVVHRSRESVSSTPPPAQNKHVVWFIVETISKKQYGRISRATTGLLIALIIVAALSNYQFNCYDVCDMNTSFLCPFLDSDPVSTCLMDVISTASVERLVDVDWRQAIAAATSNATKSNVTTLASPFGGSTTTTTTTTTMAPAPLASLPLVVQKINFATRGRLPKHFWSVWRQNTDLILTVRSVGSIYNSSDSLFGNLTLLPVSSTHTEDLFGPGASLLFNSTVRCYAPRSILGTRRDLQSFGNSSLKGIGDVVWLSEDWILRVDLISDHAHLGFPRSWEIPDECEGFLFTFRVNASAGLQLSDHTSNFESFNASVNIIKSNMVNGSTTTSLITTTPTTTTTRPPSNFSVDHPLQLSATLLTSNVDYVVAMMVWRYVCIIVLIVALIIFYRSFLNQHDRSGDWSDPLHLAGEVIDTLIHFDFRSFQSDFKAHIAGTIIVILFCDPILVLQYVGRSPLAVWIFLWSERLTWLLLICPAMFIASMLAMTMSYLDLSYQTWCGVFSFIGCCIPPAVVAVMQLVSYAQDINIGRLSVNTLGAKYDVTNGKPVMLTVWGGLLNGGARTPSVGSINASTSTVLTSTPVLSPLNSTTTLPLLSFNTTTAPAWNASLTQESIQGWTLPLYTFVGVCIMWACVVIWFVHLIATFWLKRDSMVFMRGKPFYKGKMRIRVLQLRFTIPIVMHMMVYIGGCYIPLAVFFCTYVPASNNLTLVDTFMATSFAVLSLFFASVHRWDAAEAPPSPYDYKDVQYDDDFHDSEVGGSLSGRSSAAVTPTGGGGGGHQRVRSFSSVIVGGGGGEDAATATGGPPSMTRWDSSSVVVDTTESTGTSSSLPPRAASGSRDALSVGGTATAQAPPPLSSIAPSSSMSNMSARHRRTDSVVVICDPTESPSALPSRSAQTSTPVKGRVTSPAAASSSFDLDNLSQEDLASLTYSVVSLSTSRRSLTGSILAAFVQAGIIPATATTYTSFSSMNPSIAGASSTTGETGSSSVVPGDEPASGTDSNSNAAAATTGGGVAGKEMITTASGTFALPDPQPLPPMPRKKPTWQKMTWTAKHYRWAQEHGSGFMFDLEKDQRDFERRHGGYLPTLPFPCLETMNFALAMSNEVYFDVPEEQHGVLVQLASTERGCFRNWLEGVVSPPQAESDELSPEEAAEVIRPLNVSRFGYELFQSMLVHDVQIVIAMAVGQAVRDAERSEHIIVSFRGTANMSNAVTDIEFGEVALDIVNSKRDIIAVHTGFHSVFEAMKKPLKEAMARAIVVAAAKSNGDPVPVFPPAAATSAFSVQHARGNSTSGGSGVYDTKTGHVRTSSYAAGGGDGTMGGAAASSTSGNFNPQSRASSATGIGVNGTASRGQHHYFRPTTIPIVVTGHSLGGALATLAAFAFSADLPSNPLTVYTFGCPRVGNTAFRRAYNAAVPRTFRVVNENDTIAMVRHCARPHVGKLVSMDRDGNILIDPQRVEKKFNPLTGNGSALRNHFLLRYARSLDAVMQARGAPLQSFLKLEQELALIDTAMKNAKKKRDELKRQAAKAAAGGSSTSHSRRPSMASPQASPQAAFHSDLGVLVASSGGGGDGVTTPAAGTTTTSPRKRTATILMPTGTQGGAPQEATTHVAPTALAATFPIHSMSGGAFSSNDSVVISPHDVDLDAVDDDDAAAAGGEDESRRVLSETVARLPSLVVMGPESDAS